MSTLQQRLAPKAKEPKAMLNDKDAPVQLVTRRPDRVERGGLPRARRVRIGYLLLGGGLPVLILVAWQVAAATGGVDPRLFSSPSRVWTAGVEMARTGELQDQLWITTKRLLIGYAIGALAGIVLGLVISQSRVLRAVFEPLLRALYTVPKLAILPILLFVFGIGEAPKLAFIALGTFFITGFATLGAGLRVPPSFLDVAKSHNLSAFGRFRRVVLPASMPEIVDGLRLSSGIAVLLVIAVEFINSSDGIGYVTWQSWQLFAADRTYVGIVVVSLVGVVFSALIGFLGRLLMPWQRSSK